MTFPAVGLKQVGQREVSVCDLDHPMLAKIFNQLGDLILRVSPVNENHRFS